VNRINKMIRRTILEIVLVISFVIISIPIWNSFNLEKYASIAMYYDNIKYNYLEVSDYSDYVLYQVNDNEAKEVIKPITLSIKNDSNIQETYALWIVVSKTSTLEVSAVKISVENNVKLLSDLENYEDEDNYYFLLTEGNMVSKELAKDIQLWIDINYNDIITDKYLSFDFANIERQML